jgi:oxygen-independent coproporphyrinogen-3 oxidase
MPEEWLGLVERAGCGDAPPVAMTGPERATEYLLMSLRLVEGSDLARFAAMNGGPPNMSEVADLETMGMVTLRDGRLSTTAQGRMVLNAILRRLVAD